jgi:hypothetical protein
MDTEMAESLGITIASSDREPHAPIPSPISSVSYKDGYSVFEESYEIACYLRHYMDDLKNCDGTDKFLEWPYVHHLSTHSNSPGMLFSNNWRARECFHFWDPYWGVSTIMTHAGQAEAQPEALTITVHSRAAIDTEILTSEFVVCYLAAQMAWHYDSDHQELKKASEGTRRRWPRLGKWICGRRKSKVTECKVTEESMLELRSPMRGLPVSSTHTPLGDPILTSTDTDPARLHTWTQH